MKKTILFIIFSFIIFKNANSQVICIMCFDQNDSISSGVNNLILNGSFENHTCIFNSNGSTYCPNSLNYSCDILNWTCNGGGTSTYASMWDNLLTVVPDGISTVYFGNDFCEACSTTPNDTSCLSRASCTTVGVPVGYPVNDPTYFGGTNGISIQQTVNGLVPGNTYVLEFWAGGEDQGGFGEDGLFGIDVGFGDTLLRCKPSAPGKTAIVYIVEFIASASSHTIKFTNWGHICTDCTELILDNVRLYTLSELAPSVPSCATGSVPTVNLASSDSTWCDKKSIDYFDLSTNSPTSWQWSFPGGVPSSSTLQNPTQINYPLSGTYDVTLIACNSFGCDSITYTNFIHEYDVPLQPPVSVNGDTMCVTSFPTYAWYNVNSLTTVLSTNQCFTPSVSGNYFVVVTDTIGCEASSPVINILTTIDDTEGKFIISLNPNPFKNEITVSIDSRETIEIILYDITSRKLFQQKFTGSLTVNTELFAKGIYLFELKNKNGIIGKGKIVKE